MKKITYSLCAVLLLVSVLSGCGTKDKETETQTSTQTETTVSESEKDTSASTSESSADTETDAANSSSESTENAADSSTAGKHLAEITIKDYGKISLELDADKAPISVANFIKLANEGFYDNLTFHRIITGFMIQGGDPEGTGMGGSDETIKGEFSNNDVDNPLSHTRGALSMARSQDMDSASSQFFIVHQDSLFLDGDYAVFGYVTEGMDVVDQICEKVAAQDENGTVASADQPVIESIKIIN